MLQLSGTITLSQIRSELGLGSGTSPFLLSFAEKNGYVFINDCSPNKPNEIGVTKTEEWYSYNHSATCCGFTFSDTYAPSNFATLTYHLNFKNRITGDNLSFSCFAQDRPNRFDVRDGLDNLLSTTGWLGTADYSGPWGATLNEPSSAIINLAYDSSKEYVLKVDVGPAAPINPVSDAFEVIMTCPPSPAPSPTPSPAPSPTPSPAPSPTPTPAPSPTPTPAPSPTPEPNREYTASDCGTGNPRIFIIEGNPLFLGSVYRITSSGTSQCFTIDSEQPTADPPTYIESNTEVVGLIAFQLEPGGCASSNCSQV